MWCNTQSGVCPLVSSPGKPYMVRCITPYLCISTCSTSVGRKAVYQKNPGKMRSGVMLRQGATPRTAWHTQQWFQWWHGAQSQFGTH